MHEWLIKRLREIYPEEFENQWDFAYACQQLMHEAADAIEELSKKYLASEVDNTNLTGLLAEEHAKNLWIPVTERLPEEPYGCLAIVWDNNVMTGDTFLNYYPEYIGFDGESWNDCDGEEIPLEVVYWMKMPKIPEPPKEKPE